MLDLIVWICYTLSKSEVTIVLFPTAGWMNEKEKYSMSKLVVVITAGFSRNWEQV